jgi:hypothetical protein
MANPPYRRPEAGVPEFIALALARVGIDWENLEHRERFHVFLQWAMRQYEEAQKEERERELIERERRARVWTWGLALLTLVVGSVIIPYVSRHWG